MARRRVIAKRQVLPDPIFGETLVSKFVNCMMIDGKRSAAEKQFYGALEIIESKGPTNYGADTAVEVFKLAIENSKPVVEVKSRRVGGATYQVPVEVRPARRVALSMRWLVDYARNRGEKSMRIRLAGEIMDASQGKGNAVKKREDVHRMAEANKAFSHFRF